MDQLATGSRGGWNSSSYLRC